MMIGDSIPVLKHKYHKFVVGNYCTFFAAFNAKVILQLSIFLLSFSSVQSTNKPKIKSFLYLAYIFEYKLYWWITKNYALKGFLYTVYCCQFSLSRNIRDVGLRVTHFQIFNKIYKNN